MCGNGHGVRSQSPVGQGAVRDVPTPGPVSAVDVDPDQRLPRQRGGQPPGVAAPMYSFYVLAEWLMSGLAGPASAYRAIPDLPAIDGRIGQRMDPARPGGGTGGRRDEHLGPAARFLAKRFAECLQAID